MSNTGGDIQKLIYNLLQFSPKWQQREVWAATQKTVVGNSYNLSYFDTNAAQICLFLMFHFCHRMKPCRRTSVFWCHVSQMPGCHNNIGHEFSSNFLLIADSCLPFPNQSQPTLTGCLNTIRFSLKKISLRKSLGIKIAIRFSLK